MAPATSRWENSRILRRSPAKSRDQFSTHAPYIFQRLTRPTAKSRYRSWENSGNLPPLPATSRSCRYRRRYPPGTTATLQPPRTPDTPRTPRPARTGRTPRTAPPIPKMVRLYEGPSAPPVLRPSYNTGPTFAAIAHISQRARPLLVRIVRRICRITDPCIFRAQFQRAGDGSHTQKVCEKFHNGGG